MQILANNIPEDVDETGFAPSNIASYRIRRGEIKSADTII
jgi:hypothetical protein